MFFLSDCLWFSGGLLCGMLVLVGFLNQRLKAFPIFFWLMGCYFVQFLVQFIIRDRSDTLWIWASLLMTGVSFPLELAVLYTLWRNLIPSRSALATRLAPLSRNVLAFFVILSIAMAALIPMASHIALRRVLISLWFATDSIELGLFLYMLLLTFTLGISWKQLHTGLVLGWGIGTSIDILATLLLKQPIFLSAVREAGFNVCALLWLWYVLRPDPSQNLAAPILPALSLNQAAETCRTMLAE